MYDRLRIKYFMDAAPPFHVPPMAKELRWGWLTPNIGALAITRFDEDDEPYEIMLSPAERGRTIVRQSLLHEMTHIRVGPKYSCGSTIGRHGLRTLPYSSVWRQEAERLVRLGALQL